VPAPVAPERPEGLCRDRSIWIPDMKPENRALVVMVVGVAVVVAAGGAYFLLTAPPPSFITLFCGFGGSVSNKPFVVLNASTRTSSGEQVTVAGMQPSSQWSAGCFAVNLSLNGTSGTAARLPTRSNGTVNISLGGNPPPASGAFTVQWTDPDGDGKLAVGDSFTVTHPGGLPSPGNYTFSLIWYDESTLDSVDFQTP
jgi:hypothetical protein